MGDRIRMHLERRGWSLRQLAERAKVSPSRISQLMNEASTFPRTDTAKKIAEALGVDVAELTGEKPVARRRAMVVQGVVAVPIVRARAQASGSPDWQDTYGTSSAVTTGDARRDERLLAAIVSGDCMSPQIQPGDEVIFDPERRQPEDGQMVLVVDDEGNAFVKYYRVDALGQPFLRAHDGTEVRPNGARVAGTVVGIVRKPIRDPEA